MLSIKLMFCFYWISVLCCFIIRGVSIKGKIHNKVMNKYCSAERKGGENF